MRYLPLTPNDRTAMLAKIGGQKKSLQKSGLKNLYVFGSVARGKARRDSDIDFVADLSPKADLIDFIRIKQQLEKITGRAVDLATRNSLHPGMRQQILAEMVQVF